MNWLMTNGVFRDNVVSFPVRRGLAGPAAGAHETAELIRDFLTIANYCDSVAYSTPWPNWIRCHALEFRRMVTKLKELNE